MGTCCARCLPAKIRDYALDAENGAVTVTVIENPNTAFTCDYVIGRHTTTLSDGETIQGPVYCANRAEFALSFFSKK